ncbi:hypothetical protein Q3304_17130 [Clostridioides sp. GD02377]|uniref:hypothetical protein n=1 Tax=unclassified Clostridioides TaxID=2635829 RepID=UPI0038A1CC54
MNKDTWSKLGCLHDILLKVSDCNKYIEESMCLLQSVLLLITISSKSIKDLLLF